MGFAEELAEQGYVRLPLALTERQISDLEAEIPTLALPSRIPIPLEPLGRWLESTTLPFLMKKLMGEEVRPVRALLMAKGEGQQWGIDWHRDTTFAVAEPRDVPGFDGWVNKGAFYQVQAPLDLVARVLTLRIHLDAAGSEQGPLLVRPGSHRNETHPSREVPAARGEVLAMHPLLLHASEPPRSVVPRRVLHVEWAAFELPEGLKWAWF